MHTSLHMGINFKRVISRVDGAVSVVLLTQGQRSVDAALFVIIVISCCDVVQVSILEMTNSKVMA